MLNLRKAQVITRKLDFEYQSSLNSVKWDKIYQSENEIMEDLRQIHIPDKEDIYKISRLYKGYEYIHSFARQAQIGKTLSQKQITQCKRLALEIKKAASIKDCY